MTLPKPDGCRCRGGANRHARRRFPARPDAARHVGGTPRQSAARWCGRASLRRVRRRGNRSRTSASRGRQAWRCAIRCCGCSSCADGTQQIDPVRQECRNLRVTVHDLRDLADDVVGQRLIGLREAKSHQQLDDAVFELAVSLLPGQRARRHLDLDIQAADAMSYRTLMADLAKLYRGQQLPELRYSYPEYRQEIARREAGPQPAHDADRDWWSQRDPATAGPAGTTRGASRKGISRSSTRRWHWLDPTHPRRAVRTRPAPAASPRR